MLYTVPKAPNASNKTAGTMTTPVRHSRQKGNPTHVSLLSPFAPVAFRVTKTLGPLCALALLLLPLPALAGSWVTSYQSAGETDTPFHIFPWVTPWTGNFPGTYPGFSSADSKGDVTATLTWVPSGPNDQPPLDQQKTINVLEDASATAQYTAPGYTQDASDGLGDPSVVDSQQTMTSQGRHIIKVSVSQGADGTWQAVVPSRHLSASDFGPPPAAPPQIYVYGSYTVQPESPLVMNIVPLRIDATSAHTSRIFFRVEPANAVASLVTFTAPILNGSITPQTQSNVSGEFSFNFDEAQLPSGSSNFVLQWTPGSNYIALADTTVNVAATRAPAQASNSTGVEAPVTIGDNTPTGTGGPDSTVVFVPIAHNLNEYYEKFSYAIPIVPESETIHVGFSTVNITTTDNAVVPSVIAGWTENHYYQDDNGTYGSTIMQGNSQATLPAQTNWFQSKDLSSDLFFAPNHNLIGVGFFNTVFFELDDSPSIYMPYIILHPEVSVPIN